MQLTTSKHHPLKGYIPDPVVCFAVWAPQNINTAQVLTDAFGIKQIIRTNSGTAGQWTVTLAEAFPQYDAELKGIVNDNATIYHRYCIDSRSISAGTLVVSHRQVAVASVASGDALSDGTSLTLMLKITASMLR